MAKTSLSEYFDGGRGGQSVGDYFSMTPGGELTGLGAHNRLVRRGTGASPDGLGRLSNASPGLRDLRQLKRGLFGLGQEAPVEPEPVDSARLGTSPGAIALAATIGIAVRGWAGYTVGKAVAPSRDKQKKYAYWGIPNGIFFGALGLGIQAAVGLSKGK